MTFTIIECEQRSSDWYAARAGRVTGSCAADMLSRYKDGKTEAAGCRNLRTRLMLERVMGRPEVRSYASDAMRQGIEREPDAAVLYEAITGEMLTRTGFLRSDELLAGCSLDGHVGDFDGIVELKCPIPATHMDYLRTGKIPADYATQMMHNLLISGAKWCDWMSYNPDFPEELQSKLVRVERNDFDLAIYKRALVSFLETVEREVDEVKEMRMRVLATRAAKVF